MAKKIHVRPGKSQSKVGFAVGIIFCLIGMFIAIPTFGPFGILWTLVAGWITFVHYRNGFTDKKIDSKVIEIDENGEDITFTSHTGFGTYSYKSEEGAEYGGSEYGASAGSVSGGSGYTKESVEERLRKLQSLYDQALITREEYEAKKKDILEDL